MQTSKNKYCGISFFQILILLSVFLLFSCEDGIKQTSGDEEITLDITKGFKVQSYIGGAYLDFNEMSSGNSFTARKGNLNKGGILPRGGEVNKGGILPRGGEVNKGGILPRGGDIRKSLLSIVPGDKSTPGYLNFLYTKKKFRTGLKEIGNVVEHKGSTQARCFEADASSGLPNFKFHMKTIFEHIRDAPLFVFVYPENKKKFDSVEFHTLNGSFIFRGDIYRMGMLPSGELVYLESRSKNGLTVEKNGEVILKDTTYISFGYVREDSKHATLLIRKEKVGMGGCEKGFSLITGSDPNKKNILLGEDIVKYSFRKRSKGKSAKKAPKIKSSSEPLKKQPFGLAAFPQNTDDSEGITNKIGNIPCYKQADVDFTSFPNKDFKKDLILIQRENARMMDFELISGKRKIRFKGHVGRLAVSPLNGGFYYLEAKKGHQIKVSIEGQKIPDQLKEVPWLFIDPMPETFKILLRPSNFGSCLIPTVDFNEINSGLASSEAGRLKEGTGGGSLKGLGIKRDGYHKVN